MYVMCKVAFPGNYHSISIAFQYGICDNQLMIKAIKIPLKRFEYDMGFQFVFMFPQVSHP